MNMILATDLLIGANQGVDGVVDEDAECGVGGRSVRSGAAVRL
jgi:hypothetical protein